MSPYLVDEISEIEIEDAFIEQTNWIYEKASNVSGSMKN
jgi:hypothetical protein